SLDCIDSRDDAARFDSGERRLRDSRARRKLLLRQSRTKPAITNPVHGFIITNMVYRKEREDRQDCLSSTNEELPDADAILGRHVLRVAFLHVERGVPRIDIAQRRERADLSGRMRIGHQLLAQRAVALQRAPDLTEAEEETLVASEAVDHRRR